MKAWRLAIALTAINSILTLLLFTGMLAKLRTYPKTFKGEKLGVQGRRHECNATLVRITYCR